MPRRVAPERNDVSEERINKVIRVVVIGELVTLAVNSNLTMVAIGYLESSAATRATRRDIPEDGIHHNFAMSAADLMNMYRL
jgi:hypothetical protein